MAIYVDDILIATNDMGQMKRIKENLKRTFKMKDMGPVHYCLGIEFKQDLEKGTITMSQKGYIEEILTRFGMKDCKTVATPNGSKLEIGQAGTDKRGFDENDSVPKFDWIINVLGNINSSRHFVCSECTQSI